MQERPGSLLQVWIAAGSDVEVTHARIERQTLEFDLVQVQHFAQGLVPLVVDPVVCQVEEGSSPEADGWNESGGMKNPGAHRAGILEWMLRLQKS